jgi:hypothetical protein
MDMFISFITFICGFILKLQLGTVQ